MSDIIIVHRTKFYINLATVSNAEKEDTQTAWRSFALRSCALSYNWHRPQQGGYLTELNLRTVALLAREPHICVSLYTLLKFTNIQH
jgi:hypothetical protein